MVFQISSEDVDRYDLDQTDLGKWCFIIQGTIQGFYTCKNDAEQAYNYVRGK